jgi:hypothetical protein
MLNDREITQQKHTKGVVFVYNKQLHSPFVWFTLLLSLCIWVFFLILLKVK